MRPRFKRAGSRIVSADASQASAAHLTGFRCDGVQVMKTGNNTETCGNEPKALAELIDTYRASTISGLSDSKFDTILKPSKPKKPVSSVTILGFDTEFTSDGRLLSVQLA